MKTANEYLELRNKKMEEWLKFDEQVKGQWSLIETNADKYNLGRNSKYIDIGNVGELYKANINRLVKLGYKIVVTKNGTRLYFDEKDYNDYVNSNKKSNLKKDTDEQVKEDKKVEVNKNNTDDNFKLKFSTFDGKDKDNYEKEYNSFEDFIKDLETIPEFFKIFK